MDCWEEGGWNINVMRQNKRKVPLGKSCVLTTRFKFYKSSEMRRYRPSRGHKEQERANTGN